MTAARSNHWWILAGLLLGALLGVTCHHLGETRPELRAGVSWVSDWIAYPVGQVFLRLLFLVVVPLVFAALAGSVARLGQPGTLGRMGLRMGLFFLGTMTFSVAMGLVTMRVMAPGAGFSPELREELMQAFAADAASLGNASAAQAATTPMARANLVLDMFLPRNMLGAITGMQMLPLIVFAVLFGLGVGVQSDERRQRICGALDSVTDAMIAIVGWAMRLAPAAVLCLIFAATSRFGLPLLARLSAYVGVVLGLYLVQLLVLYPALVAMFVRRGPVGFMRACVPIIATAFSTSSSNATLPTSMRVCERDLGIRPSVCSFVLPMGATVNMNGTALFEGCAVLFVAQVFGIDLSLSQQLLVLVLCVLSAVGVAGVPGGSLPLLMIVMAQVGVPPAGIALILGVDRLLDMGRTVINVMGDVVTAAYVERGEAARARA
ncbi:MAG: dicarboxylate/amino acid:cation symporter [Planctomycetes bacterium]|nr:dicarboxylate/amino acid:cation symporter [Planctomycetota bacterium]